MNLEIFPDAEAVVVEYLQMMVGEVNGRVSTKIDPEPIYPLVRLTRVGGTPPVPKRLDRAEIELSVWGNTDKEAWQVAAKALAAMIYMEGYTSVAHKAFVTGTEVGGGISWSPDLDTTKPRYTFSMSVYLHKEE